MRLLRAFLFFSQLFCVENTYVRENIVFEKVNDVFVNDAKWLVTFVHDLAPYIEFINKVESSTNFTKNIVKEVASLYESKETTGFKETFRSLEIELNILTGTFQTVKQSFDQYNNISPKTRLSKRSILPIVGEALSALFGVVSSSDMENINRNIKTLAQNQQQLIHDVHVGLSILNLTKTQVSENRHAIIDLVKCVTKMDVELERLSDEMNRKYKQLSNFVNAYHQTELLINELKLMIQNMITYLNNLKLELSVLSMNHLSVNTITPNQLKTLLSDLKTRLPINYQLPENPQTNIWYFYEILHCTTYLSENKIFIVLNVPMLNIKNSYEIYRVINIPIPFHEGKNVHEELAFKYKLESESIMMSNDRSKYSLLSENDLDMCINKKTKFCNPRKAMYPTNLNKLCVIAQFLDKSQDIEKYCTKLIIRSSLPNAKLIHDGFWVISTKIELKFIIHCQKRQTFIETVKSPVGTIRIPNSCTAANEHMSIPMYNVGHTDADVYDSLSRLLTFSNITNFHIWQNTEKLGNLSKFSIPKHLLGLTEIPLDDVFKHVNKNYETVDIRDDSDNILKYVCLFVIISACVMIIVILYFKCCKRNICCRLARDKCSNNANSSADTYKDPGAAITIELDSLDALQKHATREKEVPHP